MPVKSSTLVCIYLPYFLSLLITPCRVFFSRFVCQQPRMDAVSRRSGHSAGDRGFFVVRQVRPGAPLPHRVLHARGVSGRREIQKGSRRRRTLVSPAYQRRRRTTRAAGKTSFQIQMKQDCNLTMVSKFRLSSREKYGRTHDEYCS